MPGGESGISSADAILVDALRRGDEAAFATLIDRHHAGLIRLALSYVPSRAVAEEVVQDTWLSVLEGIDRFEGRSSLKTWLFRILVNQAKRRGERESRSRPLSSFEDEDAPVVDPSRFLDESSRWAGFWASPPKQWEGRPEERLVSGEVRALVEQVIESLPPNQRTVVTLRDVHGLDAGEVCDMLGISEGNQRVLLHRGRGRVRAALERYFDDA